MPKRKSVPPVPLGRDEWIATFAEKALLLRPQINSRYASWVGTERYDPLLEAAIAAAAWVEQLKFEE